MNTSRLATFLSLTALAAASAAGQGPIGDYRNLTEGGPLRPGVYGRIEVRGPVPPPVIYAQPVMANSPFIPPNAKPIYLYVPPGQVRKWKNNCARWSACEQPVLFVRMDDSPGRWGTWRLRRDQVALHGTNIHP